MSYHTLGNLWEVEVKLRGLSELLGMACADPPVTADGFKGISMLIAEAADKLAVTRQKLEESA